MAWGSNSRRDNNRDRYYDRRDRDADHHHEDRRSQNYKRRRRSRSFSRSSSEENYRESRDRRSYRSDQTERREELVSQSKEKKIKEPVKEFNNKSSSSNICDQKPKNGWICGDCGQINYTARINCYNCHVKWNPSFEDKLAETKKKINIDDPKAITELKTRLMATAPPYASTDIMLKNVTPFYSNEEVLEAIFLAVNNYLGIKPSDVSNEKKPQEEEKDDLDSFFDDIQPEDNDPEEDEALKRCSSLPEHLIHHKCYCIEDIRITNLGRYITFKTEEDAVLVMIALNWEIRLPRLNKAQNSNAHDSENLKKSTYQFKILYAPPFRKRKLLASEGAEKKEKSPSPERSFLPENAKELAENPELIDDLRILLEQLYENFDYLSESDKEFYNKNAHALIVHTDTSAANKIEEKNENIEEAKKNSAENSIANKRAELLKKLQEKKEALASSAEKEKKNNEDNGSSKEEAAPDPIAKLRKRAQALMENYNKNKALITHKVFATLEEDLIDEKNNYYKAVFPTLGFPLPPLVIKKLRDSLESNTKYSELVEKVAPLSLLEKKIIKNNEDAASDDTMLTEDFLINYNDDTPWLAVNSMVKETKKDADITIKISCTLPNGIFTV